MAKRKSRRQVRRFRGYGDGPSSGPSFVHLALAASVGVLGALWAISLLPQLAPPMLGPQGLQGGAYLQSLLPTAASTTTVH